MTSREVASLMTSRAAAWQKVWVDANAKPEAEVHSRPHLLQRNRGHRRRHRQRHLRRDRAVVLDPRSRAKIYPEDLKIIYVIEVISVLQVRDVS